MAAFRADLRRSQCSPRRRWSDRVLRVLIHVPDLDKLGGVANYFRSLRGRFRSDAQYLSRGSRGARGVGADGVRLLEDYWRFVFRLLRAPRVDLVHVNTSLARKGLIRDAVIVRIAKLLDRKVAVFFRGWDATHAAAIIVGRLPGVLRRVFSADLILVLVSDLRDRLVEWGYTGEVIVESTVVSEDVIAAASTIADHTPASSGERPSWVTIFLARLEVAKGVYIAIDAHREGVKLFPQACLDIAGEGTERANLRSCVAAHRVPNVEFVGYVRGGEKVSVLRHENCYLLPTSHGEGLSNSVLEAKAFGLPIITRPVGELSDVLDDGKNGSLTSSTEGATYAELIFRLLSDPELTSAIAARNRAAAHRFSAKQVAGRLDTLYHRVVVGNSISLRM